MRAASTFWDLIHKFTRATTSPKFPSFVDSGLLFKLSKSKKYVLKFKKEEERIKKIGRKEGEKIGELNKAIQMAKGMKQKGIDVKLIAELSGLTKEQIEKL